MISPRNRPRTLAEIKGQDEILSTLVLAFSADRGHHAYLFTGPKGVGKRTACLILGQSLLCETRAIGSPCGSCGVCQRIIAGSHPDWTHLGSEGTPIKIETIRNISRQFAFGSFEGGARVIFIENAENMTIEASNALLKSLEEPPRNTFFLLSSSISSRILPTIISRCQPVPLSPLSPDQVKEIISHEDHNTEQLTAASRFSGGSPGQAMALLDDPVFNNRVSLYERFFEAITARPPDILGFADWTISQASSIEITGTKLNKERELIFRCLNLLTVLLRDLMLLKTGAPARQLVNLDIHPMLEELTVQLTLEALSSILQQIDVARESTEGNVTPRLVLEALVADLSLDLRH